MSRAFRTTVCMGLVAAVLSVVAAFCYPWPQAPATAQRVNQPLFTDLKIEDSRSISVMSYDRDERRLNQIQLKRVRDQWVIPAANDYPAGNSTLIGRMNNALSEATVLEVKSDDEGKHQQYGVIDPDAFSDPTQAGFGTKITLADTNSLPIASLIVGEKVGEDPNQRFVRIAGQPTVYVIAFDSALLSTTLADWTDHNLLGIKRSAAGQGFDIAGLTFDNYRIDPDHFDSDQYTKVHKYRLKLLRSQSGWQVAELDEPEGGQLKKVEEQVGISQDGLAQAVVGLQEVPFQNVIKNEQPAIATDPSEPGAADVKPFYGFRRAIDPAQGIDSLNGSVAVNTPDGIDLTLHLGILMDPIAGQHGNYVRYTVDRSCQRGSVSDAGEARKRRRGRR